jgi:transaldolase
VGICVMLLQARLNRLSSYYKQHGYKTIVMGASFRNVSEIKELAGIDFLTISPNLLEELKNSSDPIEQKLSVERAGKADPMEKTSYVDDEAKFRWDLLEEQMAFDKLHEGIKKVGSLRLQCHAVADIRSCSSLTTLSPSKTSFGRSCKRKAPP